MTSNFIDATQTLVVDSLDQKTYLKDVYIGLNPQLKQSALFVMGTDGATGSLGLNDPTAVKSSPVQTISGSNNWKQAIAGPYGLSAGIKTDGTLWTWGYNTTGQLGLGDSVHRSSPTQVGTQTTWKKIYFGGDMSAGIKTDGTLWMWGFNITGELGTNNLTARSSPVQTVAGGTNWKHVALGELHVLAMKNDGTVWGWGDNTYGCLGTNLYTFLSSPTQIVAHSSVYKDIQCSTYFSGGITNDGQLLMWGKNDYGQLGQNTTTTNTVPSPTVAAGGTAWKQLSLHPIGSSVAAIKEDGTLWTWGRNTGTQPTLLGQFALGDGTSTHRSSPVQVYGGGTNWRQVSVGQYHMGAIKTDGTLWAWGQTGAYSNMDISGANKSIPTQNFTRGNRFVTLSTSNRHTLIIEEMGDLFE